MRVRTEEKRREIIVAAAQLFLEQGYDRTSMSAISERIGGSKTTLYGYFSSKEDLLKAVLAADVEEGADRLIAVLKQDEDLREGLLRLGVHYLQQSLAPLAIANLRTVANQPAGTELGAEFYNSILRPAWERLAAHFAKLMDDGALRRASPWTAAMHWKGLVEGEVFEQRLLGAIDSVPVADCERIARDAVAAFWRIYGAEPTAAQA